MKREELLDEVLRGRLLIVGEYRGSRAERKGFVDRKSGEKIDYIRAIHLIECACRGNLDRAILYQRLPEIIETPEEAVFPYVKGGLYVFFLTSLNREHGQVICFMAEREPELIEDGRERDGGPEGAPLGAPSARRLTLLSMVTTAQTLYDIE